MATTHAPGTGIGPGDARKHGRRSAVIAAVVLAGAAIAVPFGARSLDRDGALSAAPPTSPSPTPATHRHHARDDATIGPRGDLPPLLPSGGAGVRAALREGARVRVGDITDGTLRRTPGAGWQVVVRWDGRLQPLPTHGPVGLGAASWVSASGLLYTRVPTGITGRFHVYAWDPHGGTAYTPPTLVARDLGRVCFDRTFTAFGDCRAAG